MTYHQIKGYCDFHDFYKKIFDSLPYGAVCVEVGCYFGHSVAYLATLAKESGKNIIVYAVDTFEGSAEHKKQLTKSSFYDDFMANMKACGIDEYVMALRMQSVEAAKLFDDKTIDFCFIDAAHDYENVKADCLAWEKKVKTGGILAGHDYSPSWPGVIKAVDELYPVTEKIKSVWKIKM